MAITLFRNDSMTVAEDAALTEILSKQIHQHKDSATYTEHAAAFITLADTASDEEIDLQGIATAKFIYIETDKNISIKLSGTGNTAIPLKPATTSIKAKLSADFEFTSLHITNDTADNASLFVCVLG